MGQICFVYLVDVFCSVCKSRRGCRARRRKKLAKALDRQARKLRAKGIAVDLEALKAEYLSQHRHVFSDSEDDKDAEETMIDVVGGDSDDDSGPEDFSLRTRPPSDAMGCDSSASDKAGPPYSYSGLTLDLSSAGAPAQILTHRSTPIMRKHNPFSIESLLNT